MSKSKLTKELEALLAVSISLEEKELLEILLIPQLQEKAMELYLNSNPNIQSLERVLFKITRHPYRNNYKLKVKKKVVQMLIKYVYLHKELDSFHSEQIFAHLRKQINLSYLNYFFSLFGIDKRGGKIKLTYHEIYMLFSRIDLLDRKNMIKLLDSGIISSGDFANTVENYPDKVGDKQLRKYFREFKLNEKTVLEMFEKYPTCKLLWGKLNKEDYREKIVEILIENQMFDRVMETYPDSMAVWMNLLKSKDHISIAWQKIKETNPDIEMCLGVLNAIFGHIIGYVCFPNERNIVNSPALYLGFFDRLIDDHDRKTYDDIVKHMFEHRINKDHFIQSLVFLLLFSSKTDFVQAIIRDDRFEPIPEHALVYPVMMHNKKAGHNMINILICQEILKRKDFDQTEKLFNMLMDVEDIKNKKLPDQYEIAMRMADILLHNISVRHLKHKTIQNMFRHLPHSYRTKLYTWAEDKEDIVNILASFQLEK